MSLLGSWEPGPAGNGFWCLNRVVGVTWPPSGRVTLGLLEGLEYALDAADVLRMERLCAGCSRCRGI